MRPHEELFWQMSGLAPATKKLKLEPSPEGLLSPVPMQGPFTDVPHPELYATEPSTGRPVVAMQSPLLSLDTYNIHRHVQRPRIDPEPRIVARYIDQDVPRASGNPRPFTMA